MEMIPTVFPFNCYSNIHTLTDMIDAPLINNTHNQVYSFNWIGWGIVDDFKVRKVAVISVKEQKMTTDMQ